jgi:alanine racemase
MDDRSFNRVIVRTAALENNFLYIKELAGEDVPVMAMVKADGYGHGMVIAAKAFARAGCEIFGVAELREGVLLRRNGISGDIYVTIGFDPADVELFFSYNLKPVIYSLEGAAALDRQADILGVEVDVQIKLDTGMGRLGLLPEDFAVFQEEVAAYGNLRIAGIMSHFPESDLAGSSSTRSAIAKFERLCTQLSKESDGICHIANSGAVLNFPDAKFDMVRAGIALYGYNPAGPEPVQKTLSGRTLIPAMEMRSRVLQVKSMEAGTGISYGHTYVTKRKTRLAILPVGYEDGYSRQLSNSGRVLIRGQFAPVLGRVCMNMCMVDVTDIDGVQAGDEVVLIGRSGEYGIDADDIAGEINSISYEVLCKIGNNNNREYREE